MNIRMVNKYDQIGQNVSYLQDCKMSSHFRFSDHICENLENILFLNERMIMSYSPDN